MASGTATTDELAAAQRELTSAIDGTASAQDRLNSALGDSGGGSGGGDSNLNLLNPSVAQANELNAAADQRDRERRLREMNRRRRLQGMDPVDALPNLYGRTPDPGSGSGGGGSGIADAARDAAEAIASQTEAVRLAQEALDSYAPAQTEMERLTRAASAADGELQIAKSALITVLADDTATTDEVTAAKDRFISATDNAVAADQRLTDATISANEAMASKTAAIALAQDALDNYAQR